MAAITNASVAVSPLAAGAAALRRFWRPFLLIQSATVALALAYRFSSAVRAACEVVGGWKTSGGILFAACSGVVAGGLLPEVAKLLADRGVTALRGRAGAIAFNMAFFAFNGVVVDRFYQLEAVLIGSETTLCTIVTKTLFDQLVFAPLWLTLITLLFLWRKRGFSLAAMRPALRRGFYRAHVVPLLIPNWFFWLPMVSIIYALPSPLQFTLFVPALGAWSLIMVVIADADVESDRSLPVPLPSKPSAVSPARLALRPLVRLAFPMVLARATQAVISFADTYQVSHLGEDAIAATATGALNTYALVMLPMGTVFIVQTFVSQLVGKGDREATPRFAWYGLAISAIAGLFAVASIPLVAPILGLFGYSTTVRVAMTDYMVIRAFAVGAIVGTEALGNWYGGLGNTWISMVAGMIAMVSNVALNAVLIDGRFGLPALGVRGTALASSIASTLGFVFLFAAFLLRRGGAPRGRATGFSRADLLRVLRFGAPNGLNWFLEFAAFQIFINLVISGLGTATLAAFNVVMSINMVAAMPAFGVASAGAILVARHIGRGARDDVWPQTKLTLLVATAWQAAIGALYVVFPRRLLSLFVTAVDRDAIFETGIAMLMLAGLWQAFDATAMTLAEALRAAGDTAWSATARLLLAWGVFVPSALFAVRVLDTGAVGAMVCLAGYLALVAVALAYRFHKGAWRSIELVEPVVS